MRIRLLAGGLLGAGALSAGACVQILGDVDFNGPGSGGASASTSQGSGGKSASTTGSGGGGGTPDGGATTTTGTGDAGPPPGSEVWAKGFQSTSSSAPTPSCIAVDKQGNTYVTGEYLGTITFPKGSTAESFTAVDTSGLGLTNGFLASFDRAGAYRWGASFDTGGLAPCVAVDAAGNSFVDITFSTASIKVGPNTYQNPTQPLDWSMVVASFDPSGGFRWGGLYAPAYSHSIAVNTYGDVVVTGNHPANLTFGSQAPLTPGDGLGFAATFDGASGNPTLAAGFGTSADANSGITPGPMAVDTGNSIIVGGIFFGNVKMGSTSLSSVGLSDIFIVKLGDSVAWAKSHGGSASDFPYTLAVDPGGSILLSGGIVATADLGGGNMPVSSTGHVHGFFAKYNGAGAFQWAKTFGGELGMNWGAVASDVESNIILAGDGLDTLNFGGDPLKPAGSKTNVYLAKLDPLGAHVWSKMFGDANGQYSPVVAVDPTTQEIVLAFGNSGTVQLGQTMIASDPTGSSLVVARFHP